MIDEVTRNLQITSGEDVEGSLLSRLQRHTVPVRGFEFNPFNQQLLVSGADDGELCIWDLTNPRAATHFPPLKGVGASALGEISYLSWNRKHHNIVASTSYNGTTVVWDLNRQKPIISFPDTTRRHCSILQWNPDMSTQLIIASDDDNSPSLRVWDVRNTISPSREFVGHSKGGAGFLLCLVLLLVFLARRKKKTTQKGDILGATELQGPSNYHYRDLKSATKDFNEDNKLGEGGFGDVYKGVLKNGKTVAVKKLAIGRDSRVKANFESEVKLISNVHHRNLVRLLGCCSKGPELLLVYEYMANKSLDQFLFGDRSGTLNWKQRFYIIVGMARGLAYLHEDFHVFIIHRDIKSSNILLVDDLQPKIADFGLVKLLPENQSHLSTKFAGTLGYTSPEYAIHGQLSEKVDTYSYGIVLLEIISGRKSTSITLEPVSQYLLEWFIMAQF